MVGIKNTGVRNKLNYDRLNCDKEQIPSHYSQSPHQDHILNPCIAGIKFKQLKEVMPLLWH
jgi:hypothetical protein